MKKVFFLVITLLIASCGTSEQNLCTAGPCYLAGSDYTAEEARALTEVTAAIVAAGFTEPGFAVKFIHSPDASFKGTTWAQYRNPAGVEPRDPSKGYNGICIYAWCMVFVRTYDKTYEQIRSDLVHELTHALGYVEHNDRMKAVEQLIKSYL